ncbi:hypothetical protein GCM10027436_54150 [Actinophytocola sediminis]
MAPCAADCRGFAGCRVTPRRRGDHWVVTVQNPSTGFVSLRATASDRSGNTVTETITRAYRVA